MNLTTNYLGLKLKSPLMPGASPLVDNIDNIKRLEDAGAAAIVMHSLFAEQIEGNRVAFDQHIDRWQDNFAEATSFFPSTEGFAFGPEEYLAQIAKIKAKTSLPVIASLNGTNLGTWVDHAKLVEQAGADALELNTYFLGTSRRTDAIALEHRVLDITRAVRKAVQIPIAVKLSPSTPRSRTSPAAWKTKKSKASCSSTVSSSPKSTPKHSTSRPSSIFRLPRICACVCAGSACSAIR